MSRTITPADLMPLVEKKRITLIDVRRHNDFEADTLKLPGAEWKNPEQAAEWIKTLPRDQEVVIYCMRGGSVSNAVVDQLRAQGVPARFIEGGIEAWKNAGGATVAR
jgi:rhodanese-related sulfurtransferase